MTGAPDGSVASESRVEYADDYDYSAVNGALYYVKGSHRNLYWRGLDPETGVMEGGAVSPSNDTYWVGPPIRVSRDGRLVLIGPGDLFDGTTLELVASLPIRLADVAWLEDGGFVTVRDLEAGDTLLEQWTPERLVYNSQPFAGEPLRILEQDGRFVLVTQLDGQPAFEIYTPTDDPDADGVPNPIDRFPLDPAASVDSDRDGWPDAWNPGMDAGDSTEGLTLDAFPLDSACQLASQGVGGVCDIAAAIPPYTPTDAFLDALGVIHLPSPEHGRIFRYDAAARAHLNPIVTRQGPGEYAYSPETHRIYLAYETGEITQIRLDESLDETPFTVTQGGNFGLGTAGSTVVAVDPVGTDFTHFTFSPEGELVDAITLYNIGDDFAWNPLDGRLYFLWGDIHWYQLDAAGAIVDFGRTDYGGRYPWAEPIRLKADGSSILTGGGERFDAPALVHQGSFEGPVVDALWVDDGFLTLDSGGGGTARLRWWSDEHVIFNEVFYPGSPLRIFESGGEFIVVTSVDGIPVFQSYVPSDDGDGDGVSNEQDAFPLDPAASVDSDGDGWPDPWNPGMTQEDSTSGLEQDAFPDDLACQTPEHELGGVCDFAGILPASAGEPVCAFDTIVPDQDGGNISLPPTLDAVPLCNAWVIIGDEEAREIAIYNVLDGRLAAFYPLPGPPGDLELDAEDALLYAALPDSGGIAIVDLVTANVSALAVPGEPRALTLGNDGSLFVATRTTSSHTRDLYHLPPDASAVEGGWRVDGGVILFNRVYDELVVADSGLSPSGLMRYAFDPVSGPVELQSRRDAGSNGLDLALSPDGEQLVFAAGGGNGTGYTIFDFVSTDVESARGEWVTGAYPRTAAFHPSGELLLTTNYSSLLIFDSATYAELERHTLLSCYYGKGVDVSWSRGGSFAFATRLCGVYGESAQIQWRWVAPK